MPIVRGRGRSRVVGLVALTAFGLALTACAAPQKAESRKSRSKEYFAESAYGVKASPRVTNKRSKLPRGGGRDQIGKPYKVKGRWFYPKEEKNYSKVGEASWYGDAFHGRLTANGEIYDMTHLTAAHPTMPLPSYARVTNLKNGSSVVVRVNDRGPFARGRVIDLSRKAADMLDYAHSGKAKVQVDYLGRAPLHGKDDSFLLASYRPAGARAPAHDDGLPSGVMIAMSGATPTSPAAASASVTALNAFGVSTSVSLPDFGPIAPERPSSVQVASIPDLGLLAYAEQRVQQASVAFTTFDREASRGLADKWRAANGVGQDYVAVGTFTSKAEADALAASLASFGATALEVMPDGVSLTLRGDGRATVDELLQAAWSLGADNAFVVRP